MRRWLPALLIAVAVLGSGPLSGQSEFVTTRFGAYLDSLRRQAGIPGLSAAIVLGREVVWEAGFGTADVEGGILATPDTPYYVADVTQTFTAAVLLECIDDGFLRFDDLVRVPTPQNPLELSTVRELLSHTTPGANGPVFRYDPARFARLSAAVEVCADEPFRRRIFRHVLNRYGLSRSVPGLDLATTPPEPPPIGGEDPEFRPEHLASFAAVLQELARPYRVDRRGRPVLTAYPGAPMNAAVGLVTTARDLARYQIVLDNFQLVSEATTLLGWSLPFVNDVPVNTATAPRMGLGWFVQQHVGEPLVWHFGYEPDVSSALVLKLPGRQVTLVLLANSDGLAAGYSLRAGDVTKSPFARLFLSLFG